MEPNNSQKQQVATQAVENELSKLAINEQQSATSSSINNDLRHQQKQIQSQSNHKVDELRKWMKQKGCIIHPSIQIPSFINGYQGVATTAPIPPRTLIIAVPSSLILTVSKCYKDPQLKSIFTKNDDLFDYQSSDDAEFNVLCVFMMYHKLNIQTSPWKVYLQTIGEPQTAIDWEDKMYKGLNKSVIEQIIHVRIQCDKLGQQLSEYLKTTKQFSKYSLEKIRQTFNYCYRAVMTRCFGYYFGQASLIPVADLINHGCEVVDHQLINVSYEKGLQFNESYKQKSDKIDLSLLGIKRGKNVSYPYRQKFLIQNNLVQNNLQSLSTLNRQTMNNIISSHNSKLFQQNPQIQIQDLEFCSEDDSEDNDTDVDEQHQRQVQLQRLQLEELQQIQNFKKYYESIRVETYQQVEERFTEYEKHLGEEKQEIKKQVNGIKSNKQEGQKQSTQQVSQSRNDLLIKGVTQIHQHQKQQKPTQQKHHNNKQQQDILLASVIKLNKQINNTLTQQSIQIKQRLQTTTTITSKTQAQSKIKTNNNLSQKQSLFFDRDNTGQPIQNNVSAFSHSTNTQNKAVVPIKLVQDSSSDESQDDQQWGLLPSSYFTLSTGSAVGANQQLYNSYGSRTNRFLLIWYGFCYRNNLFDSVSLRLHVQFHKTMPKAQSIVLDTYVGGQGLSFRKNQKQIVHGNEVSRQFRLKENKVCMKLLTFLRLYLLEYYKGNDLYKICVTIPSSTQFQIMVLSYYKDIVNALYERYPMTIINQLKQQLSNQQTSQQNKTKINFKIIYLEQQRKILDSNVDTMDALLGIWNRIKQQQQLTDLIGSVSDGQNKKVRKRQQFDKYFYRQLTISQLRKTKPYLKTLKNNYPYVVYHHSNNPSQSTQ